MIYVFGATGYIGRYLCCSLKEHKRDFVALGRAAKVLDFFKQNGVQFQYFDFNDNEWEKTLSPQEGDVFVNLSACLAEHETPVEEFFNVNTLGTYKLLDYAVRKGVKKYIMTTSHKVYNDVQGYNGIPIPENVPLSFKGDHTPYIISKIAAENFVEYYNKDFNMQGICLRLTGVRGYGEILGFLDKSGNYKKSALEIFFEHALNGENIEVWGDQTIKRDHVYIKDVVSAIEMSLDNDSAAGIFNIASGKSYSQYDEAVALINVFSPQKKGKVTVLPEKQGLSRGYLYDISKAERELKWHPQYTDLEKMYRDYKIEWQSKKFHNYHNVKKEQQPLTF